LEEKYANYVKNAQKKDADYDKDKKEHEALMNKWNSANPKKSVDAPPTKKSNTIN